MTLTIAKAAAYDLSTLRGANMSWRPVRSGKLPFAFIALPGDVFGADTLGTDGIGPEGEDPGRFNPPPCETTDKSTGNGGLRYQIFSFFDNSSEKCIKSALLSITDREAKKNANEFSKESETKRGIYSHAVQSAQLARCCPTTIYSTKFASASLWNRRSQSVVLQKVGKHKTQKKRKTYTLVARKLT
jgi:hypothetical protein